MNRGQFLALPVLATLAFGCATPPSGHKAILDAPKKYSRIAIACVDVRTSGEPYDLRRNVARADREPEIARIVSNRARKELAARGFSIAESRPVFRFSANNAIEPLSPAWRPFLTAAEATAFKKAEVEQAFDERLELDPKSLFQTIPDADAWLLLLTEAHFQEPIVVVKPRPRQSGARAAAMSGYVIFSLLTGTPVIGPLPGDVVAPLDPALQNWTRHAFVLVDPATGQILWSRWRRFQNEDPRSNHDIEKTARKVLSALPALPR